MSNLDPAARHKQELETAYGLLFKLGEKRLLNREGLLHNPLVGWS